MKKLLFKISTLIVFLIIFGITTSNAQTTFGSQEIITTSAVGANAVYACDIDGDGDIDVLSASQVDNSIAWYENTDGAGAFGIQQLISDSAFGAKSVYACDIDGDGDMDVLSAFSPEADEGKIAWYENTDGNGSFGPQQIITTLLSYARDVYACDVDGDGDMDVFSASFNDSKIAWYENIDGNGTFGEQQIIGNAAHATSIYACDINNDGTNDVLASALGDNEVVWFQNMGDGTFGEKQVITDLANSVNSVYASDLDGDGDNDVLSACSSGNKIAWYENIDDGAFGEEQIIVYDSISPKKSVYACDLDNDGDNDVLSADYYHDRIAWYENTDGAGTFGEEQMITTLADYAMSVFACDIDGDGDNDVLSASYSDNKIAWYRNLIITDVETLVETNISIYPNPTSGIINLDFADNNNQKIIVFDILGKMIIEKTKIQQTQTIDLSGFENGIYILSIQTDEEVFISKIIKE
jgi:hypothetical protein